MDKTITAIVAHEPTSNSPIWKTQQVRLTRPIAPNEVLVRMVASGICHSDIACSIPFAKALGVTWPKILGHEGSGIVEAVGEKVTNIKNGDRVLLSHDQCDQCTACRSGRPPHCDSFVPVNLGGDQGTFEMVEDGTKVSGCFFGQSSFAALSICKSNSCVVVNDLVSEEELKLLAPLGCGMLTGAGSIWNEVKAGLHDVVLIAGFGAVGSGALMAAKIVGCKKVIAIDRVASRLELAKELGADFVLDTSLHDDWIAELEALTQDDRISVVVETSGNMDVINGSMSVMGAWGTIVLIGAVPMDGKLDATMKDFYYAHKRVISTVMGGGVKEDDILKMIKWWKEGKFPVEKLVKFFDAKSQAEEALHSMDGIVVKPVLVW